MRFRSSLLHFLLGNRNHLGARDRTLVWLQTNPQPHSERIVGHAEVIQYAAVSGDQFPDCSSSAQNGRKRSHNSDSVVYFAHANAVAIGAIFLRKTTTGH